jgi:DNA-binding NarL/FixJ family response regulator
MPKDIRVLVVCEDPFVRSWMSSLLVRDWRTRVVGETEGKAEMLAFFKNSSERTDMILIDADGLDEIGWLGQIPQILADQRYPPAILVMGRHPDGRVLHQMSHRSFVGYLIKDEIRYSLAWAASLAAVGHWVMTPGVEPLLAEAGFDLPGKRLVVNGRGQFYDFTESEARVARLAFIFSVERRDLADELKISKAWCYGVVSSIYDKLGMEAILTSQVNPTEYLGDNPIVLAHLKEIIQRLGGSKKAQDMESLAFHLLTMPEIS